MGLILPFRPNKLAYPGGIGGINPAHPAAQNLYLSAVAVNSGTFTSGGAPSPFVNLVTGAPLTRTNIGANPGGTFSMDGSIGASYAFSSSANSTFGLNLSLTAGQSAAKTVGAIFKFSVQGGVGVYQSVVVFNVGVEGLYILNGAPDWFLGSDNLSSITLTVGHAYYVATSAFPSGATTLINFVVKDLTTGQVRSATTTRASTPATVTAVGVGNDQLGSSDPSLFPIAAAMYSGAALGIPQMLNWAQDPWFFWYPPQLDLVQMINAPPPASGAILMGQAWM
jgi:hypothetical protein